MTLAIRSRPRNVSQCCWVLRIIGNGSRVIAVEVADSTRCPADMVIVSIGVVPNVEIAANAGLAVDDSIIVDDRLLTSGQNISAIGDCAFFPSRYGRRTMRLESVQNAVDQARCIADRLVGKPGAYESVPWFWSDQGELKLQIAGVTTGCNNTV